MRRLTTTVAALLLTAPGIAAAAEAPCLTPKEFTSLAGYALPSVITGTTQRCAATLGPSAFLTTNSRDLATRYATRKAAHWPDARAAFIKLSSKTSSDANKIFTDMPDASLQQVVDAMLEGMVAQQIPTDRCGAIDNAVRLLAPLPPENTAELITLLVGIGTKAKEKKESRVGAFTLCPN